MLLDDFSFSLSEKGDDLRTRGALASPKPVRSLRSGSRSEPGALWATHSLTPPSVTLATSSTPNTHRRAIGKGGKVDCVGERER